MANSKITDLTAATDPASTDVFAIVVDTGSAPTTKKVTWTNLFKLHAPLASPTFTGTPTLPSGTIATSQTALDSSTKVATTAFATAADAAALSSDQNVLSNAVFS